VISFKGAYSLPSFLKEAIQLLVIYLRTARNAGLTPYSDLFLHSLDVLLKSGK